jgi:hypothetical protein
MMSCNFLRTVLLGNTRNITNLDNLLRSGTRGLGLGLRLALIPIALTTVAAAQLAATAPSPNTQSAYAGDSVSFTVSVSGQQGAVSYDWQFSVNGAPYTPLSDGLQASGSTVSGSLTPTLSITNSQVGDTGRFRCLVTDSIGAANSGPGSLTVTVPPLPTVPPPGNVAVAAGNTATFMVGASGYGLLHYQWQVSIPAGVTFGNVTEGGRFSGSTTATLQITNTQFSDAGWYRCLVTNAGGTANSGRATLTVSSALPTPGNFQATVISPNEIDLSWSFSDPTVTDFVLQRQDAGGAYNQLATVSASTRSYIDAGLIPGTLYSYQLYAHSAAGNSSSTAASATTSPGPPAPTHINAIPISPTQIDVTWTNPPGNFTISVEQKKANNPPFGVIGTVDTSAPPIFHAMNLEVATTYFYQVRAKDAAGNFSPYSTLAITSTLVPVPTNLHATSSVAPVIDLQWTNPFNGYTKLHLYQNGPNDLVRIALPDLSGDATSYGFTGALPNTTYSFALQAEVLGKLSAFTADFVVTARSKITIFFVHGTGQGGGDLDGLAAAVQSSIDPNGNTYIFDSGFDWSRCTKTGGIHQRFPLTPLPAGEDQGVVPPPPPLPFFPLIPGFPPNPCPNNCVVSAGAENLAKYIASKNPPGDVFIVAYSLGGNVARDMIEGQQGSGIGKPGRKLLGLVTLGTGNNGYPYEYPWDNAAVCDGIAKEIASDLRSSPANYPYNGQYIQSINTNWVKGLLGGAGYQTFSWMAAAGTFCKSPIRFPDSTQNGCPAGSSNDGIVCADSALFTGVPGGSFNRPTTIFASDLYSHTADNDPITQFFVFDTNSNGDRSAFYNGHCNMPDHISLWNPGAGSSLAQQLANFIQANTP